MKNVKNICFLICVVLLLFALSNSCQASCEDIVDDFYSGLDSEITDALEKIGISDLDYEKVYNVSLKNIADYFKQTLPQKLKGSLTNFFSLLCIVLTVSLVSCFFHNTEQANYFKLLSVAAVTIVTVNKINVTVNSLLSVIRLGGNFMLSFIPVLTFLLSVSGNPTTAFTYNSLVMAFSQGISGFINYIAVDLLGCFFCLSVAINMNEVININRFIAFVNKAVAFVLGITASIFTGFLSIRSVLAVSVDSVAVKGIRFAISSMVPVLGSSISEAYSSIIGSINIMKGSIAFIGILVILVINIPVIAEMLIYQLSLSALSYICESTGSVTMADTFRSFSCGVRMLLLLCVFQMFVLIISTGIMLTIKGGG